MELESLKVLIETETDASKLQEYESALKDLKAAYDDMRTIGDNGYLKAKNMFGNDYANKINAYKQGIVDLEKKIADINNQPKTSSKGLLSNLDLKGMVGSIGKITLALVGVRTVFSSITKAMNSYLNQNEELKNKIDSLYLAIGTAFAPLLETIVNLAIKLVIYINAFVQGLGFAGINLAKLNKTAEKIKKTLAGFDEINNIGNQQESGSSFTNPFADVKVNTDWINFIKENAPAILIAIGSIIAALTALQLGASLSTAGIIAAVGLTVAAFLIFWEQIRDIIDKLLGYIDIAINWVHTNLTKSNSFILSLIGSGLELLLNIVKTTIQTIRNLLDGLYVGIKQVINGIISIFKGDLKNGIKLALEGIKTIVTSIFTAIWTFVKGILNTIIGGVENTINACIKGLNKLLEPLKNLGNDILEFLGISSFSFKSIPSVKLPRLATGTNYVPQDMAAIIHKGEAVVPKEFNPSAFYGQNTAEELNLLAAINENLERLYSKDTTINLDGNNVAQSINNKIQDLKYRNGDRAFAIAR